VHYTTSDARSGTLAARREPPCLTYIHRLMEMGDNGRPHTDGCSNFAYVHSPIDGKLWAEHWTVNHAGEWVIGAAYVPHPHTDWRAGSQVLTR
jgi:hypothetical protein